MPINVLTFTIQGQPIAKQRSRKGKFGRWYNPQSQQKDKYQLLLKTMLASEFKEIQSDFPIEVNCLFFFSPAKTQATKKFLEIIKNDDYPYTKKPDKDNLEKWVLDCMSKIVFHDDSQVFMGKSEKYYSLNPRTEIEVIY